MSDKAIVATGITFIVIGAIVYIFLWPQDKIVRINGKILKVDESQAFTPWVPYPYSPQYVYTIETAEFGNLTYSELIQRFNVGDTVIVTYGERSHVVMNVIHDPPTDNDRTSVIIMSRSRLGARIFSRLLR